MSLSMSITQLCGNLHAYSQNSGFARINVITVCVHVRVYKYVCVCVIMSEWVCVSVWVNECVCVCVYTGAVY